LNLTISHYCSFLYR